MILVFSGHVGLKVRLAVENFGLGAPGRGRGLRSERLGVGFGLESQMGLQELTC